MILLLVLVLLWSHGRSTPLVAVVAVWDLNVRTRSEEPLVGTVEFVLQLLSCHVLGIGILEGRHEVFERVHSLFPCVKAQALERRRH